MLHAPMLHVMLLALPACVAFCSPGKPTLATLMMFLPPPSRAHVPTRMQVGCGLPASHSVVRLLLQQLSDAMSAPAAAAAAAGRLGGQAQKDAQEQEVDAGGLTSMVAHSSFIACCVRFRPTMNLMDR